MSKLTETELKRLGAIAQEASDKMRAMGQDVPPKIQEIADAAKKIKPELDKATTGSENLLTSVGKVAGAFGIAFGASAVIGAIKSLIGNALDMADAIDDTSKNLGVSAEKWQGWVGAAEIFDV